MASGKTHDLAANYVSIVTSAAVMLTAPQFIAPTIIGLMLGKYANPDVRDQEQVANYAEAQFSREFGKLPGTLWSAYWYMLAKVIPHRHMFSHMPVLGTLIAYVYLFVPVTIVAWIVTQPSMDLVTWLQMWLANEWMLHLLIAWAVQDAVHWMFDGFGLKRKRGMR